MSSNSDNGREAVPELDKLLQHRTRLGVCVLLSRTDRMKFTRLRELLDETSGNLGAHLERLEDNGYIVVDKEFQDRKPVSWYSLTEKGGEVLGDHLEAMQTMIDGAGI